MEKEKITLNYEFDDVKELPWIDISYEGPEDDELEDGTRNLINDIIVPGLEDKIDGIFGFKLPEKSHFRLTWKEYLNATETALLIFSAIRFVEQKIEIENETDRKKIALELKNMTTNDIKKYSYDVNNCSNI